MKATTAGAFISAIGYVFSEILHANSAVATEQTILAGMAWPVAVYDICGLSNPASDVFS